MNTKRPAPRWHQYEGGYTYTISIPEGGTKPRFLVLCPMRNDATMRGTAGYGEVGADGVAVLSGGVLPAGLLTEIGGRARRGEVDGSNAARHRWARATGGA
jgi:hypothetical protein